MPVAPFPAIPKPGGAFLVPERTHHAVREALNTAIDLLAGHPLDSAAEIRLLRAAQQALPPEGGDVMVSAAEHHVVSESIAQGLHQLSIAGFDAGEVAAMRAAYELFRVPNVTRSGAPLG